jgi:hypothetical protein
MKIKLFALFLAVILHGCTNKTKQITIVADGRNNYSIVVPAAPDADELCAGTFLQEHFHKISGVRLPVITQDAVKPDHTISIAKNAAIAGDDGFSITFFRNSIIIERGAGRGCIYAVGEILDKYLGVRYYSPDYIVIPESKSISVPKTNLSASLPNSPPAGKQVSSQLLFYQKSGHGPIACCTIR